MPVETSKSFLVLFFKKEHFLTFLPRQAPSWMLHAPVVATRISRRCERAVITAYRELRRAGTDDMAAFQSCTTLYRIHHPEASMSEARRLVSEWIDHHVIKQDSGPTPGCDCA